MNKKEIYRYLKCPPDLKDEALEETVDECIEECLKSIRAKSIYRIVPCRVKGSTVHLDNLVLESAYLAKNLSRCKRAVLFAATLGTQADSIIRKYSVTDITKAAIFQGVFAQAIEEYIDKQEEEILPLAEGKKLRPRFSPGYADLALENQKDFFNALEITKRIGVTLTDSFLMTPTKSVTAIIGIQD